MKLTVTDTLRLGAAATLAAILSLSSGVHAQTPPSNCGGNALCEVLAEHLGTELGSLEITAGKLLYDQTDRTERRLSDSGCTHEVVQTYARVTGTLDTSRLLSLQGSPIDKTLVAILEMPLTARVEVGFRESTGIDILGCRELAHDNYRATGSLATTSRLIVIVQLNSEVSKDAAGALTIQLRPEVRVLYQLQDTEIDLDVEGRSSFTSLISSALFLPHLTGSIASDVLQGKTLEGIIRSAGNVALTDAVTAYLVPLIDVGDGLLEDVMGRYFQSRSDDALREASATLEADLNAQLRAKLQTDESGIRRIVLQPRELQAITLDRLRGELGPVAAGLLLSSPTFQGYLEDNAGEIARLALINDKQGLFELLASAAVCDAVQPALAKMQTPSLFQAVGDRCLPADLLGGQAGPYFGDPACRDPVAFRARSLGEYCSEMVAQGPNLTLGNAASWQPDPQQPSDPLPDVPSRSWTINPGTMLSASVAPISGLPVPFMKQVAFRTTEQTQCALEMRIFKNDLAQRGLRPLIALHGGGWVSRGVGFLGLDAQIAHLTNSGYVVFAPSYRLAGNQDGSPECQNATLDEIVADVEAAFGWVQTNAAAFGADAGKPALLGQSAGAHLALSLLVSHPQQIERALLLYGPSDMLSYLTERQVNPGAAAGGEHFLEAVLGVSSLDSLDLNALPAAVIENSFHNRVSPDVTPPVFMIHGSADTIVPVSQSEGLCTALGGSGASRTTAAGREFSCGDDGSSLVVVEGAPHALDLCLEATLSGVAEVPDLHVPICPTGAPITRAAARAALEQGLSWLASSPAESALAPATEPPSVSDESTAEDPATLAAEDEPAEQRRPPALVDSHTSVEPSANAAPNPVPPSVYIDSGCSIGAAPPLGSAAAALPALLALGLAGRRARRGRGS